MAPEEADAVGARWSSDSSVASAALFEHSLDAVLLTAPDGRVIDANLAACRLLRMSRDEICRRGRERLADPADPRWSVGVRERAVTGRFIGRLSMLRGDGATVEVDVSSAVFAADDGDQRTIVVIREAPATVDAPHSPAAIDQTGVCGRGVFVQLADARVRTAVRDHLVLGLVYVRAEITPITGGRRPPSHEVVAVTLSAECRAGDVLGHVAPDDFAMIVSAHDADGLSATIRLLAARLEARNERSPVPAALHVGFTLIDVNGLDSGFAKTLRDAAYKMDEHQRYEKRLGAAFPRGCLFALEDPTCVVPVALETSIPNSILTERELKVLQLLALRRSYQEIARALYISINTVKSHVSHIYTKLEVNSRTQAVERAMVMGLRTTAVSPRSLVGDALQNRETRTKETVDFGRITLVAEALTSAVDADDILEIAVMQGLSGLHADAAIMTFLIDDALAAVATHGYAEEDVLAFFPAPLDRNLPLTEAARERRMVWVPNREYAARRYPELAASPAARSSAWIAAPLIADGCVFGGFGVSFLDPHNFDDAERAYLRTLSDVCALALHRVFTAATGRHGPRSTSSSTNRQDNS